MRYSLYNANIFMYSTTFDTCVFSRNISESSHKDHLLSLLPFSHLRKVSELPLGEIGVQEIGGSH